MSYEIRSLEDVEQRIRQCGNKACLAHLARDVFRALPSGMNDATSVDAVIFGLGSFFDIRPPESSIQQLIFFNELCALFSAPVRRLSYDPVMDRGDHALLRTFGYGILHEDTQCCLDSIRTPGHAMIAFLPHVPFHLAAHTLRSLRRGDVILCNDIGHTLRNYFSDQRSKAHRRSAQRSVCDAGFGSTSACTRAACEAVLNATSIKLNNNGFLSTLDPRFDWLLVPTFNLDSHEHNPGGCKGICCYICAHPVTFPLREVAHPEPNLISKNPFAILLDQ